jgi:hypothetical protein
VNAQVSSTNGIVTQFVAQLILKQVNECGLVVWYDPEQAYAQIASELDLPATRLVCYDGSFLELRRAVDDLLNDSQPPRLVVYVPLDLKQATL